MTQMPKEQAPATHTEQDQPGKVGHIDGSAPFAHSPRMLAQTRAITQLFGIICQPRRNQRVGQSGPVVQRTPTSVTFEDANVHNPPKITGVNFGDRPTTLIGAQGDHTLSYTVVEWGLYNAVHDKTFDQAITSIKRLAMVLEDLPGFNMGFAQQQTYRKQLLAALVNDITAIETGARQVHDYNKSQALGDLVDRYLLIRNGLHLTARAKTPGGNTRDKEGANFLQTFNPQNPLVNGRLSINDCNDVIDNIVKVFDYHRPTNQEKPPAVAAKYVKQALLSIFQAYPNQIHSDWYSQIEIAFCQRFIGNYEAAANWNQTAQDEFIEAVTS